MFGIFWILPWQPRKEQNNYQRKAFNFWYFYVCYLNYLKNVMFSQYFNNFWYFSSVTSFISYERWMLVFFKDLDNFMVIVTYTGYSHWLVFYTYHSWNSSTSIYPLVFRSIEILYSLMVFWIRVRRTMIKYSKILTFHPCHIPLKGRLFSNADLGLLQHPRWSALWK